MSTATQPMSTHLTTPTPAGDAPVIADPPRLAAGVELLGEFRNSGDNQPPSLMRRADGQVIQVSRLLYLVASRIDGSRNVPAIAELVSDDVGRLLSADQVRYVITAKLLPLGIIATQREPHTLPRANPLLALRARGTLLPERAANAVGTFFRPLFRWPVIVAVLVSVAAMDYWVFAVHGLTAGAQQVLRDPLDVIVVFALSVGSGLFHEFGHAAGCRYGGARSGRIGVGIYLVWPSFFTNVTDSYRLSRGGRLRTDLGGLYFDLIFILALAGLYVATSSEILLLVIAITHLEMLEQLLPFVRFDGYFILSDLIGVPDLFARVMPILKSALFREHKDPRIAGMRRKARMIVTGWVLCVIPLLVFTLGYMLLYLPAMDRALWHSSSLQVHFMATAVAGRQYAAASADFISIFLVALPVAGSVYIVAGLARRAATLGLRWSAGYWRRRVLVSVAALAWLTLLTLFWTANGQFRGW